MMLISSGGEFGDVAPLVKGAGWLLSAAGAVILAFRRRSKWEPPEEQLPGGARKVAGVVVASSLAALWFVLPDVDDSYLLLKLLWWLTGAAVFMLLFYGFLIGVLVHERRVEKDRVVGGFWRRPARPIPGEPQKRLSGTEAIWSAENDPDKVWPAASRSLARQILVGCYVLFIAASAGALTCGAAVVIAARTPRIEEFSVDPLRIQPGEEAVLRWRARNVSSVKLSGETATALEVARSGEQPVSPKSSLAYMLEAANSFGSRTVQLRLTVMPQKAETARKPRRSPAVVRPGAVSMEARLCRLTQNVVIRGAGWLESEGPGVSEAECTITTPAKGGYEIFVQYVSDSSRPVRVLLNQTLIAENGLSAATGGTDEMNLLDQTLGVHMVRQGANTIQFHTEHGFPLIRRIRFEPPRQ